MTNRQDANTTVSTLAFATDWDADETLYSWCSRYHCTANATVRQTGVQLFGSAGAAKNQIMPLGIDRFVKVTRGRLGNATEILRRRTLVGANAARGPDAVKRTIEQGLKYGALDGLRYCAECLQAHILEEGVGLWRLPHQLPGVAVCLEHRAGLHEVRHRRFAWLLPESSEAEAILVANADERRILCAVALASVRLFETESVDYRVLTQRAVLLLCEHHRVVDLKHLRPEAVEHEWGRSVLCKWLGREAPGLISCRGQWITTMLRGRYSGVNPLRWAILAAYLQGITGCEVSDFLRDPPPHPQLALWDETEIPPSVLEAFSFARSFTEVAHRLGVSPITVRRWARTRPTLDRLVVSWRRTGGRTRNAAN